MEHYLTVIVDGVDGVGSSLIVFSIKTPGEPFMAQQLDVLTKNSKELLKLWTELIVLKDFLLCKLVCFLVENPKLVLFGLQTGLLVKLCDDVTGSPANDRKEVLDREIGAHSLGTVPDGLNIHKVLLFLILSCVLRIELEYNVEQTA